MKNQTTITRTPALAPIVLTLRRELQKYARGQQGAGHLYTVYQGPLTMDENFLPPRLRFLQLLQFKAYCPSSELARDKRYRIINEDEDY